MSLQQFELGQAVWAFKQQGQSLVKVHGIVQQVELDKSGYIFYKVASAKKGANGELETFIITANHASLAATEAELDVKVEKYSKFQEEQKKVFEEKFGTPEFESDEIDTRLQGGL